MIAEVSENKVIGIIRRRETWVALAAIVFAVTQGFGLPLSASLVQTITIAALTVLATVLFEDGLTGYVGGLVSLFKSRKFRLMLVPIVTAILNDALSLGLSDEAIMQILAAFGFFAAKIAVEDGVKAIKIKAA